VGRTSAHDFVKLEMRCPSAAFLRFSGLLFEQRIIPDRVERQLHGGMVVAAVIGPAQRRTGRGTWLRE